MERRRRRAARADRLSLDAIRSVPAPDVQGRSPEAYSEFADVLLEFYELGDNFTYLSDNDLFTTPLIYLFDSGGVGFNVDFKGLTADFAQSVGGSIFASATPVTRQGARDLPRAHPLKRLRTRSEMRPGQPEGILGSSPSYEQALAKRRLLVTDFTRGPIALTLKNAKDAPGLDAPRQRTAKRTLWVLLLLVSVAISVACNLASHSCTTLYPRCDTTSVTIQSPNDAWVAGSYTLAMMVNGVPQHCTMNVPDPPAATQGTCSASGPGYVWATTLSLAGVCPSRPIVCNDAGACGGMVSSADCIAGHFTMQLVIGGRLGADAQPPFAEPVSLDLSVDGTTLFNETISPKATTTEPNGSGCGTCTNASDTLMLSGALASASDEGGAAPNADTGTE